MLKSSFKGQIVKNITLNESFIKDNNLFLPVVLSKNAVNIFNIKKVVTVFVKDRFDNVNESPLHVRQSAGNKNFFKKSDIDTSSSNNNLFKSIYSKNIISSSGQEEFLGNFTTVNITDIDSEEYSLITQTQVDDIRNILNDSNDNDESFIAKIYCLNDKEETVDLIEIKIEGLARFIDVDSQAVINENFLYLSYLEEFLRDFSLQIRPYRFPILDTFFRQENGDIAGPALSFSEDILRSIYDSDVSEGKEIAINVVLGSNVINQQKDLFGISDLEISLNSIQRRDFSLELIRNDQYFTFLEKAIDYCLNNNIDIFPIKYDFSLIYTDESIKAVSLTKQSSFSLEELLLNYNDIIKFRFEKDLVNKRVITAKLFNASESAVGLSLYSLEINIDTSKYRLEDVINNSISFEFINNNAERIFIEEFYLDDNLTDSNNIIIDSSVSIENYMINTNKIVLYFQTPNTFDLESVFIKFNNLNNLIEIGPFNNQGVFDTISISENIYRECSRIITEQVRKPNSGNISEFEETRSLISGQAVNEIYSIPLIGIINDQNFKSLNYFPDTDSSTLDRAIPDSEKPEYLRNNIFVKINKKLYLNNTQIFEISDYSTLSDFSATNTINIVQKPSLTSIDVENLLNSDDDLLSDYNNFISSNLNLLSELFVLRYVVSFSFILMKNHTVQYFGESPFGATANDVELSQNNLVDFVINSNQSFSPIQMSNIINLAYSDNYILNKKDLIKQIFDISNYSNLYTFRNEVILNKEVANVSAEINQLNFLQNIDKSRFWEYDSNLQINCLNNLILDIKNNDELIIKKKDLSSSADFSFVLSGDIIDLLFENIDDIKSCIFSSFVTFDFGFSERYYNYNTEILESNDITITNFEDNLYFIEEDQRELYEQSDSSMILTLNLSDVRNYFILNELDQDKAFNKYASGSNFYNKLRNSISRVDGNNSLKISSLNARIYVNILDINSGKEYKIIKSLPIEFSNRIKNLLNNETREFNLDFNNSESLPSLIFRKI